MHTHPWTLYAAVAGVSLALGLALTPLCARLALRLGVVDKPDGARKIHQRSVPYLGGIPFYASLLAALALTRLMAPGIADSPLFWPLAVLGGAVLVLGLLDDIFDLPSAAKLAVELALGLAFFFWGMRGLPGAQPFAGMVPAHWIGPVVAAVWIAGVMNAVNFSDGLDGLAGGLVFICAATLFATGLKNFDPLVCMLMACLMGAAAAFLCFNFHPASVFMGDAGALLLGFVLAAASLAGQQKGAAVIALIVPMAAMAVPVVDTGLSFLRRLRRARGGGFFKPDREHLHHRLLALGLGHRGAVLALYYLSVCMALVAFVMDIVPPAHRLILLLAEGLIIVFGLAALRFMEERLRGK